MSKLREFFRNKENIILFFLSLILTVNSLFFIVRKVQKNSFSTVDDHSSIVFFIYFIVSALTIGTILFFSQKFELKKIVKKILWTYLTTEIILLYGIEKILCTKDNFTCLMMDNFLPVATVIYFLLAGYLIVAARKKKKSSNLPENFKTWIKKQGWLAISVVFIVFLLNLGFGAYHLSEMAAVDEALWTFDRIPKYWNNVLDGEWYKTRISDKPGITVALISGAGLLNLDPKEYKSIRWQGEISAQEKSILDMNFTLRFPILLFNALMLFIFYFFIEKLLGRITAVFSIIFIGLSPILLGISTIINPDSLLWIFLPLSMLSYFVYQKEETNSYLYWAGIFLGLALLTKYVANILYVFFFLIIFLEYILNKEKYADSIAQYLKKSLIDYFTLIFFSLLTFLVFLPASWVEISKLLEGTILSQAFQKVWPLFLGAVGFIYIDTFLFKSKFMTSIMNFFAKYKTVIIKITVSFFTIMLLTTVANTYFGMEWFDFEFILASPKSSYAVSSFFGVLLANMYSSVFGIIPFALVAIIVWCFKTIFAKKYHSKNSLTAFYFILFILLYYVASTINQVSATVRYQIVIYPMLFIISAIGIYEIMELKNIKKNIIYPAVYLLLILLSVYSLNSIKPFYFSYASDLLPKKYVLNLKDMGDGSYEAAQYLNGIPDAKNLNIWSDKKGVCTFFVGRCDNTTDPKNVELFDYFIVSSGRENRTTRLINQRINKGKIYQFRIDELYNRENPDFKLEIGGRPNDYVKIFPASKLKFVD